MADKSAIREFEKRLDDALAARPSTLGGPDAILAAAHITEMVYAEHGLVGGQLAAGLQIIAPLVIANSGAAEVAIEDLFQDLRFAGHYWHLRELLHYSYNAPGSIAWTFGDSEVRIAYADPSLPRQFFLVANNWHFGSSEMFGETDPTEPIIQLLKGAPEFEESAHGEEASELITQEVDAKFRAYFNLAPDVDAPVEDHSFKELIEVFRRLLGTSLWHRYHSRANGSRGAVVMPLDELAEHFAQGFEETLTPETVRWAVRYMSYGVDTERRGENPVYFSLYRLPPDERIVMLPHHFSYWEGFVKLLRLVAQREPETYLRYFSRPIGTALTERVAAAFRDAGFDVRTEVSLREYDAALPDIDLLVISEEPTLGYALLTCEIKAILPPAWAKDQLRVLQPDSISKAFLQLGRIGAFLNSDEGIDFIWSLIPAEGLPGFDEFATVGYHLVVTSDNAGAFFADERTAIVDFRTLSRLLRRCDGDIEYVMRALSELGDYADRCLRREEVSVDVGGLNVVYEGIVVDRLLDFQQARFRSAGVAQQMAEDMRAAGDRPLDVLRMRGLLDDSETPET